MRKAILLAMAAAIVAMFAIPGSASAAWTKHHKPLLNGENVELEITGTNMEFANGSGGVICTKTISKVDFEGGTTTGKVTTFEPETGVGTTVTNSCQGKGALSHCDVHEATADQLPWPIHTVSTDTVSITTGKITNTTTGFLCPHTLELTGGTVHMTVTPGETLTTSTAHLSGTLVPHGLSTDPVTVGGTVHVLGTITYGI